MYTHRELLNFLGQCSLKIGKMLVDSNLPQQLLKINAKLWDLEDQANQRRDLYEIGAIKQEINHYNLNRHKLIEEIDRLIILTYPLQNLKVYPNSETPGQLMDRLFIISLRLNKTKKATEIKNLQRQYDFLKSILKSMLCAIEKGTHTILEQTQNKKYQSKEKGEGL